MTETSSPAPAAADRPENVGRGTIFALATIPIAAVLFGLLGYFGFFPFIVGIATPFVAAWLYRAGSGGKLTRAGWAPFIIISLVSVVIGAFASTFGAVFKMFGGGGQFGNALFVQLRNFNPGGAGFYALIGVVLGIIGIFIALRQVNATPAQQIAQNAAQWTPPPASTATPPPPAAPAPGVVLNGEPVDPDAKPDKK